MATFRSTIKILGEISKYQIPKQTFSDLVGDPSWNPYRGSYRCQESQSSGSGSGSGSSSSTPPKIDSGVKRRSRAKKECEKRVAPGCRPPKTVDCIKRTRQHPPCDIKVAPKPSYSECLKEPLPPPQFTECKLAKPTACPPDRKKVSYDGCAKKVKEELVCPEKPPERKVEKKKKEKDECDDDDICADVEPFKFP